MEWIDDGFVLAARKHGENAVIATLLTRAHGRHAGLVRGGAGRRARGVWQPGNYLRATWRARLSEHLGNYTAELLRSHAAPLLDEPLPLLALSSAAALVEAALPEREPHPALFDNFARLVEALPRPGWAAAYVRWELALLAELGFGLDLTECAATGTNDGLVFVSPRTGRAVSAAAGAPWRDRLLSLPGFLLDPDDGEVGPAAVADGLVLTGYFLRTHALGPEPRGLPQARVRLAEALAPPR